MWASYWVWPKGRTLRRWVGIHSSSSLQQSLSPLYPAQGHSLKAALSTAPSGARLWKLQTPLPLAVFLRPGFLFVSSPFINHQPECAFCFLPWASLVHQSHFWIVWTIKFSGLNLYLSSRDQFPMWLEENHRWKGILENINNVSQQDNAERDRMSI